jgi:hypothetical protein
MPEPWLSVRVRCCRQGRASIECVCLLYTGRPNPGTVIDAGAVVENVCVHSTQASSMPSGRSAELAGSEDQQVLLSTPYVRRSLPAGAYVSLSLPFLLSLVLHFLSTTTLLRRIKLFRRFHPAHIQCIEEISQRSILGLNHCMHST